MSLLPVEAPPPVAGPPRFVLEEGPGALASMPEAWDALAVPSGTPLLTHAWLFPWLATRARGPVVCATLRGADGSLRAGALLQRIAGGFASAADRYGGDWDVVAATDADRRRLWDELAALGALRLNFNAMRAGAPATRVAMQALDAAGYGVLEGVTELASPYLRLPTSFDGLLAGISRAARWKWRRRRRAFERAGAVRFRTTTGGPGLDRDLDALLRVEASGWKGRQGTAILSRPEDERLYRDFARAAAERGWLRLALLELDGVVVAGDLQFAVGGVVSSVKGGYDESYAKLSPGYVLRGETLRAAIDDGCTGYDFLGPADPHKLRWTDEVRPRRRVLAWRGPGGRLAQAAWTSLPRPALRRARDYVIAHPEQRERLIDAKMTVQRTTRRLRAVPGR
ncbi:MAG TPA: GNAT family N-acetyltransferase [Solirubrobacteraceae bacterium]|jgi:CelD/BcsL family acetyltransferase involved in cellulose biosynthesis